ncbi:MAG: tyrosine-type recombinase/integrase, partial [Acidobacteriota bacterium]
LDPIFANPDGTPSKPDSVSATVSLLYRKLKLPKGASLHSLRHTHGSKRLAAGMELPAVSARLGHADATVTTRVYSHALPADDQRAADVWDSIVGAKVQ